MNTLSLGFSGNVLRVLQLSDTRQIISEYELTLSFNINEENILKQNQKELARELSDSISGIPGIDGSEPLTAGILIETEQTFLSVFPIDFNEEQGNINSHILWELSNYFPDTYKNFNIKYFRLNNNYLNETIDEVLLIAIDKGKIEFLKNLCNSCNIRIKNIEIDQFAVDKCLKENYPDDVKNSNILIIGCKNSRLDFSMIVNGNLTLFDFENFEGENFRTLLVNKINHLSSMNIDKIFLYGGDVSGQVKNFLSEQYKAAQIEFISFPGNNDFRFSPLYGLALKNFESAESIKFKG